MDPSRPGHADKASLSGRKRGGPDGETTTDPASVPWRFAPLGPSTGSLSRISAPARLGACCHPHAQARGSEVASPTARDFFEDTGANEVEEFDLAATCESDYVGKRHRGTTWVRFRSQSLPTTT